MCKMDHGSIIYHSTYLSPLETLDSIRYSTLQVIVGAFRTCGAITGLTSHIYARFQFEGLLNQVKRKPMIKCGKGWDNNALLHIKSHTDNFYQAIKDHSKLSSRKQVAISRLEIDHTTIVRSYTTHKNRPFIDSPVIYLRQLSFYNHSGSFFRRWRTRRSLC